MTPINKTILGNEIDWKRAYTTLKRLQANLYEALKYGKPTKKIHHQIITSFSCRAIAVRMVTSNAGGKTRGVDNMLGTTDEAKFEAIKSLGELNGSYEAKAVKRVWIPKADGKTLRPLGIPTMFDRAVQTLYNFSLDVHQEHTANPRSFGFRRGRSPKQAINYLGKLTSGAGKRFLLSVDIARAYDSVSHKGLLENIPMNKNVLKEGLKASVNDKSNITKSIKGLPQGGPISPTIFNLTMNGVEDIIMAQKGTFSVRFADDILILADKAEKLEKVKEDLQEFLKPRGLILNEGKTKLCTLEEGANFLGYNIKEYPNPARSGGKRMPTKKGMVLIKPAEKSIKNFKTMISEVFQTYKKSSAAKLIINLNPKIRGGANYFNAGGGGTETKNNLGHGLFTKLKKGVYAKHRGNVGKRKLLSKYFKKVQRRKSYFNAGTFFGRVDGKEILIVDIQEIKVVYENELPFVANPNPYNLEDAKHIDSRLKRMVKNEQRLSKLKLNLLRKQDGYCPLCGQIIVLDQEPVERDHIVPISEGGLDTMKNTAVVHKTCHRKKTSWQRKWQAHQRKLTKSQK